MPCCLPSALDFAAFEPQVLGYDLLVDEELNPWLMEVNRAPALGHRLEVDKQIKTTLLRDCWALALKLRPQAPYAPSAAAEVSVHLMESRQGPPSLALQSSLRNMFVFLRIDCVGVPVAVSASSRC